jgi:hypothetical protein
MTAASALFLEKTGVGTRRFVNTHSENAVEADTPALRKDDMSLEDGKSLRMTRAKDDREFR